MAGYGAGTYGGSRSYSGEGSEEGAGGSSSYFDAALALDPLVYIRLDSASGIDSQVNSDYSGHHRDAVTGSGVTSGASLLVGDSNPSAVFRGTFDNTCLIPPGDWSNPASFSVVILANLDDVTGVNDLAVHDDDASPTSDLVWRLMVNDALLTAYVNTSDGIFAIQGDTTLSEDATYHLVLTYDGDTGEAIAYLDGVLEASDTLTGDLNSASTPIVLGSLGTHDLEQVDGRLDEFLFYGTALSGDDVAHLSDLAHGIGGDGVIVHGGTAHELDTARPGATLGPSYYPGGTAHEVDTAHAGLSLTPETFAGGTAHETDTVHAGTVDTGTVHGGTAHEVDTVHPGTVLQPPGTERSRAGGRIRGGIGVASWEPPVAGPPANYPVEAVALSRLRVHGYSDVTMVGAQPHVTVTAHTVPREVDRVVVGGKDVTWFRGAPTPVPTYSLVAPLGYGSGRLVLPQTNAYFERPGHGDLGWLKPWGRVKVQRAVQAGDELVVLATDYRGVIVGFDIGDKGELVAELGGEVTGRAAVQDKQPPLFFRRNDLGFWWWSAVQDAGGEVIPRLGSSTGITLRNSGGMSLLDYMQDLSAKGTKANGQQWTCMPDDLAGGKYRVQLKDTTTKHVTAYFDDALVKPSTMRRDLAEEPNRIYGTGVTPSGMRVKNGAYPLMRDENPPPYPMHDGSDFGVGTTDADTDTGSGISVMLWRLVITGYLDLEDKPGGFDSDVATAVIRLKIDASSGGDQSDPAFANGDMTEDAWAALFDVGVTGYSVSGSQILPMAQRAYTRKWNRSATGAIRGRNSHYDPTRPPVDLTVDMGVGLTRRRMTAFAQGQLTPDGDGNYVGSVTVAGGALIAGAHVPGHAIGDGDVFDARGLRVGMNLWAPLFAGGTLFHIAGIDRVPSSGPNSPETFELALDTRARDTMKVWEVIARNRESRRNPARAWLNQHRSSALTKDAINEFDAIGGVIDDRVPLFANGWTTFSVVAGQEGTIRSLRLNVNAPAEFVVAVFGRKILPQRLAQLIGNPLTKGGKKKWVNQAVRNRLDRDYVLLYAAGDKQEPCGYFPGLKHPDPLGADDSADDATDPPDVGLITGEWQDDAGFSYHTFDAPVLWVAIFSSADAHLAPGRIMEPQLEAGS